MKKPMATFFASIVLVGIIVQNLACAKQQCDLSKPETTPANRFEISLAEGTAFDTKTKLTWRICDEGQSYSDGRCSDSATKLMWVTRRFGYKEDDWRLPNEDELSSIVEERCHNPVINRAIFPYTQLSPYWSATLDAKNPTSARTIDFGNGDSNVDSKTNLNYIRLVRGEEWIDPLKDDARKQAAQMVLAERQKKAPIILREMPKDELCDAYGKAVRGEKIQEIGVLPDIMKLVKSEVNRRNLVFNDSQIRKKKIEIGTSECQLFAALGLPSEQNRTVGK